MLFLLFCHFLCEQTTICLELALLSYCWNFSVDELSALHDKHLNRPTLDDDVGEEHAIEIMTQEITQVPHKY